MRLFVAVEIPETVLGDFARIQNLLPQRAVRLTPENQLHLTLRFLGDVPESTLSAVCQSARAAAGGVQPFEVVIEGIGAFPNRRRPRVLWLAIRTGSDRLDLLHRTLEAEFLARGIIEAKSDFSPHVTLARVRDRMDASDLSGSMSFLSAESQGEVSAFTATGITVIQSILTHRGAIHEAVERFAFNAD